jgi:tripartite-type tricarboxylate transporter receptor subunit TctC
VTIVVPFVAGGNTDMMARLAAERLAARFHQPFVIENLGGAGGVIAAGQVARAAPDGYTLLFGAGSQLTLAPLVQKISYDPDKDLIPVTEFGTGPQILGVRAACRSPRCRSSSTTPRRIPASSATPGSVCRPSPRSPRAC